MIRTFVDSNVLIAAARKRPPDDEPALKVLSDPNREFASSIFVQLEVLPKARHYGRLEEFRFYQVFFAGVAHWARDLHAIADDALDEGMRLGLSAVDALHLAAAASVEAEQFVTLESPQKPIYRTRLVEIVSVRRL